MLDLRMRAGPRLARVASGKLLGVERAARLLLLAATMIGLVVLAMPSRGQAIEDPFVMVADLMPGQLLSGVRDGDLQCSEDLLGGIRVRNICDVHGDALSGFEAIRLETRNGAVTRATFTVGSDGIQIGQLIERWGQPEMIVRQAPQLSVFAWSEPHIRVTSVADSGTFSHFQPVRSITLLAP